MCSQWVTEFDPEYELSEVRYEMEGLWGEKFPLSHTDPDGAVRLAELANLTAKFTGDYEPKVIAFTAAAMLNGVKSGWGDDGCFFIEGPSGLPASAHDPYYQLWEMIREHCPHINDQDWEQPWDGKNRQEWAFEIARVMPNIRKRYIKGK